MIVVIVDFDNYFNDFKNLESNELELELSRIVEKCENLFSEFNRISIRLYGGWYDGVSLTKQASNIHQLLSLVSVFPKIKGRKEIKGEIDLVSSLYDIPEFKWYYTYKEKDGIPRIRIDHTLADEVCQNNKEFCPKYILYNFTSEKNKKCSVPNCTHVNKNIFKSVGQKMIDTMIACDVISAVKDENIKGLFVLSDDQDHFPSYAIASEYLKKYDKQHSISKIKVGIRNKNIPRREFVLDMLKPFNIQIISM